MALEDWDWFVKLVEAGSMTKATKSCRISQQTLSARLASLEKDLGAKLVQRGTPLKLTPAGSAFLLYVREQQQAQRDLLHEISEVSGGGFGLIKVGIAQMRGRVMMPQAISRMREQYPNIRFQLSEFTNYELVQKTERGELDIVVASFGSSHPGIDVTPLMEEQVVCIVHNELLEEVTGLTAPRAVELVENEGLGVLANCPFGLGMVEDLSGRIAYSELRNAGIRPRTVLTSEYTSTLLAACVEGVAAVFAPLNVVPPSVLKNEDISLLPLSDQARYAISVGTPMSAPGWQAVDALKQILLDLGSVMQHSEGA